MITFKVTSGLRKKIDVLNWVRENRLAVVYPWPHTEITIYDDEAATAFALKFNVERVKTRLEEMLREENEKNPDRC